jgi:hypothetical protein
MKQLSKIGNKYIMTGEQLAVSKRDFNLNNFKNQFNIFDIINNLSPEELKDLEIHFENNKI